MGCYSVKSAYIFLQEMKSNTHVIDNSGFWRNLSNLKIPPKVKYFLRRAASNCLPTKHLLRIRHVEVNMLVTQNQKRHYIPW